jgi:hypothetical protein
LHMCKGLATQQIICCHILSIDFVCVITSKLQVKGIQGKPFKDELWGAARATNTRIFQHHMKVIQSMNAGVYQYFNLVFWSRHGFSTQSKSDMFLNNLAETFNA